jgi:hypothetical protein
MTGRLMLKCQLIYAMRVSLWRNRVAFTDRSSGNVVA